ncbi:MAG TPA: UDP-N-acetylmuramoyl-tripeptide--D-alanyl-D-alanine ligase [Mycobacteriales bacterium]|nr:UDP-N-acetylmuramoyl-tripeptide--D-alanyl-D-alanine ligase [Mycobacteriales bacterium]
MRPTTLRELAAAVGGTLADATGDETVTGATIDSRRVERGDLFVALRGERTDGHLHAPGAVAAGAAAVLAERPLGVPAIVVADPTDALGRLACWYCARQPGRVVGITGSSGKTSTKDLVAQVVERAGPTVAPVGSFNNELGLPLTVLRADDETKFLVLEMSARGTGHIAWLCGVAPPEVGVVLNVGVAHLGEFGSKDAIATAKSELVRALPQHGLAILNADDPRVLAMREVTSARVVTFGESGDYRAEGLALDSLGRPSFRLVTPDGAADVTMRLVGEHHASNALAAAAVGAWAGLSVEKIGNALSAAVPRSRWRMEVRETPEGVVVINDAYNANPESVRAALKALVAAKRPDGRTWAVLGEMAELGDAAWDAHDAVGRLCVRLDVNKLVVVGAAAKGIHAGAGLEGSWGDEAVFVDDADAAIALLTEELRPRDVVLVKASRAAGLERVALALTPDEEATS